MKIALPKTLLAISVSMAFMFFTPLAASESGHHGAHVHGVAELTVALEDQTLEIEFSSPAISVVGFEHKAASQAEVDAVSAAETELANLASAFEFAGTQCRLRDSTVDLSAVLGDSTGKSSMPEHRGEDKAHNKHDEHGNAETHTDEGSHSDVSARFIYSCDASKELKSLRVGTQELPFGLESIDVMWVSERAQGATKLDATNQLIEFN